MSAAGEFVDTTLRNEGDEYRAHAEKARLGSDLAFYGATVGAVRGTIRDAARRYPRLTHDEVTALSSELWAVPVFERRLAAVVLLQSNVGLLTNTDLTRIEGFVRDAGLAALADPLARDVIRPCVRRLTGVLRTRADAAIERWARDPDPWLRRAAALVREA
ncbi:DNA alkylation repair protein [Cryobacterium zhongshanensis]|uniref:DNA alkylation repair protein n=1 Tax=Cryobacterium zhongshanensis TaxID=2928153 RepID=A0AA41QUB2_9MICO|nr:DNA alkylation repair protein [Cryobacterium zhongshanensis]MCI4657117.1 DNA alkylation repair protein [Cryobacterium zhongshanensis]